MCEIIISLKPKFAELIEKREKTHEFRKNVPKNIPQRIWIYVTHPLAELKYIAEVDNYIKFPNKIQERGLGNVDFNLGKKKSKYAYPIKKLYKLRKPISLEELRNRHSFVAPQNFAYMDRYYSIKTEVLDNQDLIELF